MWHGFYKKELSIRRKLIKDYQKKDIPIPVVLPELNADQMIENYLFNYHLPLGVALHFEINDSPYVIPMAIEEPSVIAAASNGAKLLGNIESHIVNRHLIGQIIVMQVTLDRAKELLKIYRSEWLNYAREVSRDIVSYGGGPLDLYIKEDQGTDCVCFCLSFDPVDAMGANSINSCLESLASQIVEACQGKLLTAILSNYSPDSYVDVSASIPINRLSKDSMKARNIAQAIVELSDYAQVDVYRAVTHNKGIMNGVDAVLMATGNDWRAVEAGVHAFASRSGCYRGLSQWVLKENQSELKGTMRIPLQVATVGGSLSSHPQAQWSLALLGHPRAKELAEIIAAVGLAQNFAALRALVTDGIQKGHMPLQARSLAMQAGAVGSEVGLLSQQLVQENNYQLSRAKELLDKIRYSSDNISED